MSIAPVKSFPPVGNVQPSNTAVGVDTVQVRTASVAAEPPPKPVSGTLPKQEIHLAKSTPVNYELPRDVVEVHQDPANKGQVIIQYLDKAGDVVLQVPSTQELSVERGIADEFQQAAKVRAAEGASVAGSAGEKTHGN
jgi:hypothetical protein